MKNMNKDNNKYVVMTLLTVIIILGITGAYFCLKNTAVKMILFLTAVVCLGAVLSYLIKWQKRLKKLSTMLDRATEYKKVQDSDFEKRLMLLVNQKDELLDEIRMKEEYIRIKALSELMEGKLSEDETRKLLPEFSGELSVLFVAYGKTSLSAEISCSVREKAKEMFSELANIFFAENQSSGTLRMIADFKASDEGLKENIERISRRFINTLKSCFDIDADVIYGRITKNAQELSDIYREVKEAAFLCQKDGCIIDAEKIALRDYDVYNYSVDTEISIVIYIKKGDFARAYGLIRNALDEILYQRSYPIYIIRCFMFEVAGTILKAIGETEKENGINLGCSKNLNRIFYTDSVIEMEYILKEYLKEVCERISESNKGVASPFCEKIKQYVRENYADTDMNVNAIAARFYINPAYLSNLFKRNTDVKLLDYINKVRIDEAKKMIITNPEITIEELSEKSGFKNSRTFRRIFLKYENVSPSKFAKM